MRADNGVKFQALLILHIGRRGKTSTFFPPNKKSIRKFDGKQHKRQEEAAEAKTNEIRLVLNDKQPGNPGQAKATEDRRQLWLAS